MSTPIESLMGQALGDLKKMIDVNTIVGEPIITNDGTTVIPVSRVALGFGAGGSQFSAKQTQNSKEEPMFGGGCGGGVSVNPVAFLVVKNDNIRLLPVSDTLSTVDRIVDMIPDVINKFNSLIIDIKDKKAQESQK